MPRKPRSPKIETITTQFRDLLGFETVEEVRKVLNIPDGTFSNLGAEKAGKSLINLARLSLAFIEATPARKRKIILSNVRFKA